MDWTRLIENFGSLGLFLLLLTWGVRAFYKGVVLPWSNKGLDSLVSTLSEVRKNLTNGIRDDVRRVEAKCDQLLSRTDGPPQKGRQRPQRLTDPPPQAGGGTPS